ncbi:MAG: glycosyltransferase family 2 protein [Clostridia bacterium]|nr:glycosyltransferase family 2 protein [Clostridia bacterium]
MSNIKVSIIIPVYNGELYLRSCLDAVVGQTLKDIQIIIINDGSTDGTAQICKEYLDDPRVSYYYKENEGLAAARADGITHAVGEYIGFVDADDWPEPEMFEEMYNASAECNADVAWCNKIFGENGHRTSAELAPGVYNRERIVHEILPIHMAYIGKFGDKRVISWSNGRRIYKRSFIEENGIAFDRRFRRSQDLQFTFECMLKANCFRCLSDRYLYHVRIVPNSLARGYTKNMWPLYIPLIERLYRDVEDFKEIDLVPQMHLRAFFFVVECMENEMKPTCPNDKETRVRLIREIMEHPICERFYGQIPVEKLNPLYREYYRLIHEKKPAQILSFTEKYKRRQKFKTKYARPVANFITEGPVIGDIYKAVRGKKK